MKPIETKYAVNVEKEVTVKIGEGNCVCVEGPLGKLSRSFEKLPVEISLVEGQVVVAVWFGTRDEKSFLKTVGTHIKNMMLGVKHGYRYAMQAVHAHFPINLSVLEGGSMLEIRNFLGQKEMRRIEMSKGVTVECGDKGELAVSGLCIEAVSQSAARIQQAVIPRKKDMRKFLDGIYVTESGLAKV